MVHRVRSEDLRFLREVQELGLSGKTQAEIAELVGLSLTGLRYRLSSIGFEFMPVNDVRTTLEKRRLSELLANGEVIAADDLAPAEAVSVA